jgi:hypothetical protein
MASKFLARGRRLRTALVSGGLIAGVLAVAASGPAHAVATAPTAGLKAAISGTEIHVHAVQAPPKLADVDEAFSLGVIDSSGIKGDTLNEMNEGVHAPSPVRNVLARGGGAEAGLAENTPNNADARLLELTTATVTNTVTPPYTSGLLDNTKNTIDLAGALDPLANASALGGRAAALWNPNFLFPTLGNPLHYSYGQAADAQVLNTGGLDALKRFVTPLLGTNSPGPDRTVGSSQSFSYLVNNCDGTCGLGAEIHMSIAPVRIGVAGLTVEVGGDWIMKGVATGKSTGNSFTYGPDPNATGPKTPVLRILDLTQQPANQVLAALNLQDILGNTGLAEQLDPLDPIADVSVGADARAISAPGAIPDDLSKPTLSSSNGGTHLAAAADVVRVKALAGLAAPFEAADLRVGHFEMNLNVPAGGVNCEIPVAKTANVPVATSGGDMTFTIKVPSDPTAVQPFPCDMTNVTVTDVSSIVKADNPSKPPKINFTSGTGPHGEKGTPSANGQSISFPSIGTWHPGDPPLVVTVHATVPTDSGTGIVKDEATATGTAANCTGKHSVLGNVIGLITGDVTGVGNGSVTGTGNFFGSNGVGLTGKINGTGPVSIVGKGALSANAVLAKVLAVTGDSRQGLFLALSLAALASAFGIRRLRRRSHAS